MNAGRLAAAAIALTFVIAAMVLVLGDGSLPPRLTVIPTAVPTPAPTASAICTRESEPLPSALATDPCPDAILAVELAVATVRLPIERMVIEPGPFYCDNLWPGASTPRACSGGFTVRPGQFMHSWVSFVGSEEVAAVALGLDFPDDIAAPGATRPPWNATLATNEVPPAGWVMP